MELRKLKAMPRDEVEELVEGIFLTDDEVEVLSLYLRGKSAQETAERMAVCDRTVYRLRSSIKDKLNNLETYKC